MVRHTVVSAVKGSEASRQALLRAASWRTLRDCTAAKSANGKVTVMIRERRTVDVESGQIRLRFRVQRSPTATDCSLDIAEGQIQIMQ